MFDSRHLQSEWLRKRVEAWTIAHLSRRCPRILVNPLVPMCALFEVSGHSPWSGVKIVVLWHPLKVGTRVRTPLGLLGITAGQRCDGGFGPIPFGQRRSSVTASADTSEMTAGPEAIAANESASARSRSIVAC